VPSLIEIDVLPLEFEPIPIDVAENVPDFTVDESVTDAGVNVTIVVSLLVAVTVPRKPVSVTTID
jgi:hypothetical protein